MQRVATYRDHRRAVRAVEKLETEGFDREDLRIRPVAPEVRRVAPPTPLGRRLTRWTGRACIVGLVVGAVVATVSLRWALAVAVVTPLAAAVAALVVRAARVAAHGRRGVVPTRYDILVAAGAARASHVLARWWDEGLSGPPHTADGRRVLA